MLTNAALSIYLMKPLGVGGLALATSSASIVNATVLAVLLRKKIGPLGIRKILQTLGKTLIASGLMAAAAYFIAFVALARHPAAGMITAVLAGTAVFFATAYLLKIEELKPLLSLIAREEPTGED
jgi:putative peptidoglycan lipid II flippase